MSDNQTAKGQHPLTVRILTQVPLLLQPEIVDCHQSDEQSQILNLGVAKVTVSQTANSEIAIEIEPP